MTQPGTRTEEAGQPTPLETTMTSFYRSAFWMIASAVVALSVVALGFVISTKVDVGKLQVTIENLVEKQREMSEELKSASNERYPTSAALADKTELANRITKVESELMTMKSELMQVRIWQAERAGSNAGRKE